MTGFRHRQGFRPDFHVFGTKPAGPWRTARFRQFDNRDMGTPNRRAAETWEYPRAIKDSAESTNDARSMARMSGSRSVGTRFRLV